jgi:hypothetical protein
MDHAVERMLRVSHFYKGRQLKSTLQNIRGDYNKFIFVVVRLERGLVYFSAKWVFYLVVAMDNRVAWVTEIGIPSQILR